jgi:hypothetical protein
MATAPAQAGGRLVDAGGKRRPGGKGQGRIAAEGDGHRHILPQSAPGCMVAGGVRTGPPVQPGGASVEDLHPVHATVGLAGFRVTGEDLR